MTQDNPEGSTAFLLGQIMANQTATNDKLDQLIGAQQDLNTRVTSLETDRAKTIGASGVLSVLVGALFAWWNK